MAYCKISEIKTYLGITENTDDTFMTALIGRAEKEIDKYCDRTFEALADTTRYFTVGESTDGPNLWFDTDLVQLASASAVVNDADGDRDVLVRNTDFITQPRNTTPWYGLKILSSSNLFWTYTSNAEMGIEVSGRWAYSLTPPDDIVHACIRLTAFLYRQKDAQVFDVTAIPEAGVITIPQGIPADVKMILEPYRRLVG